MQILLINDVLYGILAGAYSTVARIYSMMLELAGVTSGDRTVELGVVGSFANITTAIYTIAGIFMLFRVTIAMINMLINPDMVSDRNVGAGKVITRVITSIAMLIIFIPNGWVFGDKGILPRLEKGLLAEDGLITRILPSGVDSDSDTATENTAAKKKSFLIDDVYAAGNTVDCYYFYKKKNTTTYTQGVATSTEGHSETTVDVDKGYFHIRFHKSSTTNVDPSKGKARLCTKWDNSLLGSGSRAQNCDKYSFEIVNDSNNKSYKSALPKQPTYAGVLIGSHFNDGWKTTCPHIISGGNMYYESKTGKTDSWKTEASGIVGGWHSHTAMINALREANAVASGEEENVKASEVQSKDEYYQNKSSDNGSSNLLDGVKPEAIRFGQNTMGSFLQCSEGNDETCEGLVANSLTTSSGNDAIVDALDAKPAVMTMDFMIGLIAAVGIAIWLVIMCVDVIVRRFKLMLLQVIAPIPIISYSDPKDKMFAQWAKMYMTVYADLFLKLIAIGFATALLENIGDTLAGKGLLVFFYIVAILVFAKVLPGLLSELFGFKMGNSLKDITGMGKAAVGFGAGAAIGAAAGAYTGQGLGRVTGFASGALRGAGSGSKGNISGGAKSIAATNTLKRQGLNWFDRARYQGLGALGIDPNISERAALAQTEQARTQIKTLQDNIDGMDKMVERTPEVAAFSRKITNGVIQDPTGNKEKAMKEAFANAYDNSDKKTLSFADIKETKGYKDLEKSSPAAAKLFEQEYNDTYGSDASINISGGFRAGYMTSKSAALNSLSLLRQDKETTDLLKDPSISGGKSDVLLKNSYDKNTTYETFINEVKAATYGPQGELNNLMARQSQDLSFADRKNPNSK